MRSRLLLAASLVLLAGCKDATGTVTIDGVVSFTYSGGISGSFSASGPLPSTQAARATNSWAAAELNSPSGAIYVLSANPRTSTSHDYVDIYFASTATGTLAVESTCGFNCTGVTVIFGASNTSGGTFLQSCYLVTGSITISEVTATRIRGTFSGTGVCYSPTAVETTFTVTNGTFDVVRVASLS